MKLDDYQRMFRTTLETPMRSTSMFRKPGKWRVLEMFTWTMCLTTVAQTSLKETWEGLTPITLPAFDITTVQGRQRARAHIVESDPDFITSQHPCGPWSSMQNWNMRTPHQIRKLAKLRESHRQLLCFVEEVLSINLNDCVHWERRIHI